MLDDENEKRTETKLSSPRARQTLRGEKQSRNQSRPLYHRWKQKEVVSRKKSRGSTQKYDAVPCRFDTDSLCCCNAVIRGKAEREEADPAV
jgi:hypothetical protein